MGRRAASRAAFFMAAALAGLARQGAVAVVPNWTATWSLPRSTVFMPCNYSGFTNASLTAQFGLVDFDWSNAKVAWANQSPMDCEERLVAQAHMVKALNPETKVFVYRNLVKALPWYSSVRSKILDPAYAGWFVPFKPGGSLPNGTYHVPPCTTDGAGRKCSQLYHDQEQTPQPPQGGEPSRTKVGDWFVYNNTNDVSGCFPGYKTITNGGPQPTWNDCRAAADRAGKQIFTWWMYPGKDSGTCWFSSDWGTVTPQNSTMPSAERGHVSGYKPSAGESPPPSLATQALCANGVCDCGPGLPCGEYLWNHRNASLRQWLLDEFVGGENGLANPNVDGFFFDDGWSDHANPVPSWAPPTYRQCDMAKGGGATEENYFCTQDAGLSPEDVREMHGNWSETVTAVFDKVQAAKGFVWQQFTSRAASIDLADPRPTCAAYLRRNCVANSTAQRAALSFEFTRKLFHDPFPLPFVKQDIAMFLLVRGPFAWIGHSWQGCNTGDVADVLRPSEVDVDYGTPIDDHCVETAAGSGVFQRRWSKAAVTMDCNTWNATTDWVGHWGSHGQLPPSSQS